MFFEKPAGTWFTNAIASDERTVATPARKKPSVKKTRVRGTVKKRKKPSVKKTRVRATAKKGKKPPVKKTRVRGTAKKRMRRHNRRK
jgi:hypothetical protein